MKFFKLTRAKKLVIAGGYTLLMAVLVATGSHGAEKKPAPETKKPAQGTAPAQPKAAPDAQKTQPAPQQAQKVNITPVTQAMLNAGVKNCANRVNQVSTFLIQNSQSSGAAMFIPQGTPDAKLVSTSMEIQYQNLPTAYSSATFSPLAGGGCDAVYDTVAYWNASCQNVFQNQFKGFKQIGVLSKTIPVLGAQGNVRVFLMQAGNGCVSIKKEVVW